MADEVKDEEIEIPEELPILPLIDTVIFPFMVIPLSAGREKSIKAIDDALSKNRIVGLVAQKQGETKEPKPEDIYEVGTAAGILQMLKMPDGGVRIIVQGLARMRVKEYTKFEPYLIAKVEHIREISEKTVETEALIRLIRSQFEKAASLGKTIPQEILIRAINIESPGQLADFIASTLDIKLEDRQRILEIFNPEERLREVSILLNKELEILEAKSKIQSEIQKTTEKTQREYFLREQMKAIQRELGEADPRAAEIAELRERVEKAQLSEAAIEAATREIDRLERMSPDSAEASVIRTYLDWLLTLPWKVRTEDNLDIDQADKILEEDHYDLTDVKERILEYLAVRKLKESVRGPILCFVGPPGVGKTSLGHSIARALGRKFVRISLGGVRDEAEIRGHRRTYIGALPGRIIQGIRNAGSSNPVFMMDEIDKLGADFRGDPSAALLEVLDPEQNNAFSDHYLDVPFDLSAVMFITTANILDTIPPALLDRMEVLRLPGYIEEEKIEIAKRFLLPRQLEEHSLTNDNLEISESAIARLISGYTREAGVRNLERELATICRKIAKEVARGNTEKIKIEADDIPKYLGYQRFRPSEAEKADMVGVVTGMSWTSTGGDILSIEATIMPGKGDLILTGQLGDVMKESAQAALSYARSRTEKLNVKNDKFYKDSDIHIHVPAGATPKDGPSAGITMTTALVSILANKPVRQDIAMTGEITLRGRVLPVGGIKEKVLAARRAGIKTVILPKDNESSLEDIPENLRKEIKFIFVENMDEVLKVAFKDSSDGSKPEEN